MHKNWKCKTGVTYSVKSEISSTLEEQDRRVLKHVTCHPTIFIHILFLLLFLFKTIALKSFL
jgi:hypothetical protein